MSAEARATTIRARLTRDMTRKIGMFLLDDPEQGAQVIHDAVDEAMFYIEHLLVEIEELRGERTGGADTRSADDRRGTRPG